MGGGRLWEGAVVHEADRSAEQRAVAASEYWARLVEPTPTRHEGLLRFMLNVWGLLETIWPMERDPRYWVIVGRHGGEEGIGVRTAKRRHAAQRALAEVQNALDTLSPADFRERFIKP
jgi:hypothetical protein